MQQEERVPQYVPLNATYPSIKGVASNAEHDSRRKVLQPILARNLEPEMSERDAKRPRASGPTSSAAGPATFRGRDEGGDFISDMLGGGSSAMHAARPPSRPQQPAVTALPGAPQTDFSSLSNLRGAGSEARAQPFTTLRPIAASAAAELPTFTTITAHGAPAKDTRGLGSYNDSKVNSIPFPDMLQQRQLQPGGPSPILGLGPAALPAQWQPTPPPPQRVPVSLLPFDWSLKKLAWLTSPQPFLGLAAGGGSTRHAGATRRAPGIQRLWRRWPARNRAAPPQRLWVQRRQSWGSALTSLYHGLRHQRAGGPLTHCGVFYVIQAAPKAKHATVALFTAAGTRGCPHPTATLSCSCSALRSRMAAAGLRWDTPLERGGPAVVASATAARGSNAGGLARARGGGGGGVGGVRVDEDEPEAAAAAGAGMPSATLHDGTPSSQLSFVGAERVHSLFDFLLNDAQTPLAGSTGSQQPDVPVLLSPTHFTGGVAWRPQAKVSSLPPPMFTTLSTRAAATSSSIPGQPLPPPSSSSSASLHHNLQLQGPIPCWTTARLIAALATHHSSDFSISLVTETCCIGMNAGRGSSHTPPSDQGRSEAAGSAASGLGPGAECGPGVHSVWELAALRTSPGDAALGGWSMQSVAVRDEGSMATFVLA
ncbi:MAG: hypothetical protein WDW36_004619 [Sanguina aurantia]